MPSGRRGFSLVEVLIMMMMLAIVAMIVVPRIGSASNDARNSALETDLKTIWRQIELYKAEHGERGPHLDENGAVLGATFVLRLVSRTDPSGKVNPAGVCGPYLPEWPTNPFAVPGTGIKFGANPKAPRDDSSAWYVCTVDGTFHVNTSRGAESIDP